MKDVTLTLFKRSPPVLQFQLTTEAGSVFQYLKTLTDARAKTQSASTVFQTMEWQIIKFRLAPPR